MFILRETFTAKPGMASKLAALFKEVMGTGSQYKARILTDAVGPFNTVVMEMEIPTFGDFEKMMKEYESNAAAREKMKGYTDMYLKGRREIYQVM